MKKQITESDHVHEDWYKERPKTPEELAVFVTKLLTEYKHDYGTICHAVASAGLAAMNTVNADPKQGGITGFQASIVGVEVYGRWLGIRCPFRVTLIDQMLYPQYEKEFRSVSPEAFEWLQREARNKLAEGTVSPVVREHLQSIVEGHVPFGYFIES